MWKWINTCIIVLIAEGIFGQTWQWTELENMPFRTANNAVCEGQVNGNEYVFSFGGIDTTKIYSGIHNRCFRYDVTNDTWLELDTIPDLPKIASAASYVKEKIYIMGGYHVEANGDEISSDKVHVFNPQTNSFEADGAPIPRPIDDQVQCVYKDSLIFLVTGWSNTSNWPDVQIYNPATDSWQNGTPTPNSAIYTAFGASGYIIGDTIYYHGGAGGGSFAAWEFVRKGYINPADPTDITWELVPNIGVDSYRAACSAKGNTIFWVGGSSISYNYDGIAYDGSGGVDPSARILHYNNQNLQWSDETPQPYGVMDLRGIAKLSNDRWIICGGMDTNQVVSNRTFLLENGSLDLMEKEGFQSLKLVRNSGKLIISSPINESAVLIDMTGKIIQEFEKSTVFELDESQFSSGMFIFQQRDLYLRVRF